VFAATWAFEKVVIYLSLSINGKAAKLKFFKYPCFSKPFCVVDN
jgi:hypothetical protein